MAGTLDRGRQLALMLCAVARNSSRKDLSSLGDVSLQLVDILVADLIIFAAEHTDFLSSVESAFSSETALTVCSLISHDLFSFINTASRSGLIRAFMPAADF